MRLTVLMRFLITAVVLCAAVVSAVLLWRAYMYSPWTRDGRVEADVVIVAPDVSGLVDSVPVKDNQLVSKGDVLMVIDRERFRLALAQAEAQVATRSVMAARLRGDAARRALVGSDVISREGHEQADAAARAAQAELSEAESLRDVARLNLERTEVRSPVNGYVTNLEVFPGNYAAAGKPIVAIIDVQSFRVSGYFEETKLSRIRPGDKATIELLDGTPPLAGVVESTAAGIGEHENPTGSRLLVDVNPARNWVRLAQRIPVRIRLEGSLPSYLAMGMTCTISITPAGEE